MGNRAVIAFTSEKRLTEKNCENTDNVVGTYLHWNGGRDSVEAFLTYCKLKGFRSPQSDLTYAIARFIQVVTNYFPDGLSVGVGTLKQLDCNNYDNGVYVVDGDWKIVKRLYNSSEQKQYPLVDMLIDIDIHQPEEMRLGAEKIKDLVADLE